MRLLAGGETPLRRPKRWLMLESHDTKLQGPENETVLRGGRDMNLKNGMSPVHPGEVLREELDELGLAASALSHALGVPVNRVTMILNGQRGVRSPSE